MNTTHATAPLPARSRHLHDAGRWLAWNLPLLFAWIAYLAAIGKLLSMDAAGAAIGNWDQQSAYALKVLLWAFRHEWVLAGCALFSNLVFALLAWRRIVGAGWWGAFVALSLPPLWLGVLCLQFTGKFLPA